MSKTSRCMECNSPLIHDMDSGEMVCCKCGIVADDHIPDPVMSSLGLFEQGNSMPRVSGQLTLSKHDMGVMTNIASGSTDFSGNVIARVTQSKMTKLRRWQSRIRINGTRDRRTFDVLNKVSDVCNALSLPKTVLESASLLYRNLDGTVDLKNKSTVAVACAMVYMGCKKCDAIRSMHELVGAVCPQKEVRLKTRLANRYYRILVLETGSRPEPISIDKYISKISNISEIGGHAERLALRLAHKTKNQDISNGRDPSGLAAAYLCIASMLLSPDNIQQDITEASGVTNVTVRGRCKAILSTYDIRVTLNPS